MMVFDNRKLSDKITSLRALAPTLNEATDDASRGIKSVNAFLDEISIGVSSAQVFRTRSVENPEPDGPHLEMVSYLAYGRINGKFKIHIEDVTWTLDDSGEQVNSLGHSLSDWSQATREDKLDSFAVLPDLLGNIELVAAEKAKKAERARQTLNDALPSPIVESQSESPATAKRKR